MECLSGPMRSRRTDRFCCMLRAISMIPIRTVGHRKTTFEKLEFAAKSVVKKKNKYSYSAEKHYVVYMHCVYLYWPCRQLLSVRAYHRVFLARVQRKL